MKHWAWEVQITRIHRSSEGDVGYTGKDEIGEQVELRGFPDDLHLGDYVLVTTTEADDGSSRSDVKVIGS